MTSQFTRVIRVRLYKIVIVVLVILTLGFLVAFLSGHNEKYGALWGGLATGLLVAVIQYILDWNEHTEIEAIKELGVKRILPHRDDREHYRCLIEGATKEISVLGNTANRLLEDFAHTNRNDSQALLDALRKGVKVRILLPGSKYLNDHDQARATVSQKRLKDLAAEFKNLEYRYFDHAAIHSIFKVDDECLVGPFFPDVKSKDSPTIHAYAYSKLVGEYLKFFENEWKTASK